MMPRFVFLYTDAVIWLLALVCVLYVHHVSKTPELRAKWKKLSANSTALFCAGILSLFFATTLADSVHFRPALPTQPGAALAYSPKTVSALEYFVGNRIAAAERSYSAPFALHDFDKTSVLQNGKVERVYARLKGASPSVQESDYAQALFSSLMRGAACGGFLSALFLALCSIPGGIRRRSALSGLHELLSRQNALRPIFWVWAGFLFVFGFLYCVCPDWHVFGTDAVGNDVFLSALKSIRTAVVIGTLATFCTLPLAVCFGIAAGYFKGWVDDVIQYIYTTITSIPSVLLIAASVLMIQVFIDKNPSLYETGLERADLRLFFLSAIIGVTGWAGLARLLRAEAMKISEMDFVTAAKAFGVSPLRIMMRHIFPNVAHIVLIVAVLDFSGIVLYEAVLSYVGVGVDPSMSSFGSMINSAASEMSRNPVVWWNLLASFLFMVTLVLSANLFAGGVREVFDPHSENGERNA